MNDLQSIAKLKNAIIRRRVVYLQSPAHIAHEFNVDIEYVKRVLDHHKLDEQRVKTTDWSVR